MQSSYNNSFLFLESVLDDSLKEEPAEDKCAVDLGDIFKVEENYADDLDTLFHAVEDYSDEDPESHIDPPVVLTHTDRVMLDHSYSSLSLVERQGSI
jgi:hypothetical protein